MLVKENGEVVYKEEEMAAVDTHNNNNLFMSNAGTNIEEILEQVAHRITPAMNEQLIQEFTKEEIKEALDSIGDLKAPGPDGILAIFYKRYWNLVGDKVTEEVLQVLNSEDIPEGWNNTCVVLIPKIKKTSKHERFTSHKLMQCCL